ncbi:hypothetical protein DRQ18_05710 [bacterium]|nr:MAG: hypothetical protein DRQ18_05710 [bacterium]
MILLLFLLPQEKFEVARGLYLDGLYELASSEFSSFLKEYPRHKLSPDAAYLYLASLFMLEDYARIKVEASSLLRKYPSRGKEIMLIYGRALLELGDYDEAVKVFRKIGGDEGYYWTGEAYLRKKEYRRAIGYFRKVKRDLKPYADFSAGWCYMQLKDYAKAEEFMRRAMRNEELREEARYHLAEIYIALGNLKSAREVVKEGIKEGGEYRGRFYLLLSEIEESDGNMERAKEVLNKVVEEDLPEKGYALYRLGVMEAREGRYEEAIKTFEQIPKKDPVYPEALLWKASSLERMRKFEDARKVYDVLITRYPAYRSNASYRCGVMLYRQEKYEDAKGYLSIVEGDKKDDALLILGHIERKLKNYDLAREHYLSVKGERRADALLSLAKMLFSLGKNDEAEKYLLRKIKNYGEDVESCILLGRIYYSKKDFEKAESFYRRAYKLSPGDEKYAPLALQGIGWAYLGMGDYRRAFSVLDTLIIKFPGFKGKDDVLLQMGDVARSEGNYEQAEYAYRSVKGKKRPEALFHLGEMYYEMGNYRDAVRTFNQIMKEFPLHPGREKAYYMLALSLRKMGEYTASVKVLEEFLKEYPEGSLLYDALVLLGDNFYDMEEYEKARNYYERAYLSVSSPDTTILGSLRGILFASDKLEGKKGVKREGEKFLRRFKGTKLEPGIYLLLGDVFFNNGEYEEAVGYYKNAKGGKAYYLQGLCYARLGKVKEAEESFLSASHYPEFKEKALLALGKMLYKEGRYEEAKRYLYEVKEGEGGVYYALCFLKEGNKEEAKRILSNLLGKTDGLAELELGKICYEEGNYKKSEELLEQAKEGRGTGAEAYLYLGRIKVKEKRYEEALLSFLKVKYLFPESELVSQALLEAGEVAEKLKRKDDARRFYMEVMERKDNEEAVNEARRRLNRIR